ncbi:MAG: hypothetical protein AB8B62_06695 [Roseobacter sp.]
MISRLIFVVFLLFTCTASAMAEGWVMQRVDGDVRVSVDGKTWSRAKSGDQLASGTWIKTGNRGRAILGRGAERIVYRPKTLAAISVSQPTGQTTQVTHQKGSVFLSVTTKKNKRTSVVTPHLAAVIKGTVLEVTTTAESASVRVDKGLVEVQSGGRRVDVSAGRQAVSDGRSVSVETASVTSQVEGAANTFSLELREAPTVAPDTAESTANNSAVNSTGAGSGTNGNGAGNGNNGNGNGNGGSSGESNGGGNGNGNSGNGNGNGGSNGGGNGNGNNGNGNGNGGSN